MKSLYLDYAATTPVDPEVAAAMGRHLEADGVFGNPASRSHRYGWQAEQAVEQARGQVAALVGADPREVVWTSGATEANNLALKGVCEFHRGREDRPGRHLITSVTEHKAVLDVVGWLERQGYEVTRLRPGTEGVVTADQVEDALRPDTLMVSLMWVNNETGVCNDIPEIARRLRARRVLLHVDAAQALGKVAIDWGADAPDLMSVCAHKLYGPKGVGALLVRREPFVGVAQQIHGGGHERGMRSGTLPTHQLVGFGVAAQLAGARLSQDALHLQGLRERFVAPLLETGRVQINGHPTRRVPGIVNLAFSGIEAETLMAALPELAVSSGSACNSATVEPSHVLLGMGLERSRALNSLRFSFGRATSVEDVDWAALRVRDVLQRSAR